MTGPRFILEPLHQFMLSFIPNSKFLVPFRHWRNSINWQQVDLHNALSENRCHISFSNNEKAYCISILEKIGLSNQDKFICIHARDPKYHMGQSGEYGPRDTPITIVEKAMIKATSGDVILFSPAFASFGMFKNEYDRGEQFVKLVKNL
jgi:hypothetical protein